MEAFVFKVGIFKVKHLPGSRAMAQQKWLESTVTSCLETVNVFLPTLRKMIDTSDLGAALLFRHVY